MVKSVSRVLLIVLALSPLSALSAETSPGELAVESAAKSDQFTFILFYRANDRNTQAMYQTLKDEAAKRPIAVLPIQLDSAAEKRLIERFDATRTPAPSVVVLAPNGAVTGVFTRRIKPQEVDGAIVTPGFAECVKGMQENRIVLLCVQPESNRSVPDGVQQFQADPRYRNRTQLVTVSSADPAEARLLTRLRIARNAAEPITVLMAPPGVMLGTYNAQVTSATLNAKLVKAGKCCDDPNCKHRRSP